MKAMSKLGVILAATLLLLLPARVSAQPASAASPEAPRLRVDTSLAPPTGRTLAVRAGGDFQAALNAANPGDVITLEAGATFVGPFRLPAKAGSRWIIVRSSTEDAAVPEGCVRKTSTKLPAPGCRVDPSYAPLMPKLVSAHGPALVASAGAHHYRLIGLEIKPHAVGEADSRRFAGQNLVVLGERERSIENLPHHIIIDRCYVHGDPKGGARRGLAMNSRHTAVIDSHFSDFKEVGADSQAILGWNGSGPFKIENNYLEGAGENVMFGGATPTIWNMVPADIEIRRNHFFKPLAWKIGEPNYEGTPWSIKNLFELKNARRVLIEGNLFENSWAHAQDGFAVLFTVRTEDDAVPWAVVEDVAFVNNVVRRSGSGINFIGIDDNSARGNGRTQRVAIRNNLFENIGGAGWGGGRLFQLQNGTQDVAIERNTGLQTEQIIWAGDAKPHSRFVFANNVVPHNSYGIIGSGASPGRPTLERYFPGATVRRNVMAGGSASLYPPDNFFPAKLDKAAVKVRAAVVAGSSDIGVDFDKLRGALGPELAGRAMSTMESGS
jgi:hypothetical protein